MQLKQTQFVAVARQGLGKPRRTAIALLLWEYGIQTGDEGGQLGRQIFRFLKQPDALSVFADFLRFAAAQVI